MLLSTGYPASADTGEDAGAGLILRCDALGERLGNAETISIEELDDADSATAAATVHLGTTAASQKAVLAIRVGEVAECIFSSGNRVRVKVGEGNGRPYGMCGANPEIFGSIWVNERKIASRFWFAGHCREEDGEPRVSFKITGGSNPSMQKCQGARPAPAEVRANAGNAASRAGIEDPLSVCVDFPDLPRFPRDEREYPPPGKARAKLGSLELLAGAGAVCDAVRQELTADFATFGRYADATVMKLKRPQWGAPWALVPELDVDENESIFDFDNDGTLDRIRSGDSETTYMDAIGLTVSFGAGSSARDEPDSDTNAAGMELPCQLDAVPHPRSDCPPTSQSADNAGFSVQAGAQPPVRFRARYAGDDARRDRRVDPRERAGRRCVSALTSTPASSRRRVT